MELKNVKIKRIGELKTFPNSDFKCVNWVVQTDEQYPQTLQLQCNNEKAENLIKFNKVDDVVDVSINLLGREWTNNKGEVLVFNTIEAWKVFKSDSVEKAAEVIDKVMPPEELNNGEQDDLPF